MEEDFNEKFPTLSKLIQEIKQDIDDGLDLNSEIQSDIGLEALLQTMMENYKFQRDKNGSIRIIHQEKDVGEIIKGAGGVYLAFSKDASKKLEDIFPLQYYP